MYKLRLLFGMALLIISIMAISCGSSVTEEVPADEDQISASDEEGDDHADDEHSDDDSHGEEEGDDHATVHEEVPHEYEEFSNPLVADESVIRAGAESFATYCVACHGNEGKGDGPTAATLDPPPADFTDAEMMTMSTDAYLYWRIAEGGLGDPFNSAMPPWKAALTEEQVWQLVTYLRTLPN